MQKENIIPEIKITDGIYFTDFRKPNAFSSNNCLNSAIYQKKYFFFLCFGVKNKKELKIMNILLQTT